MLEANDPEEVRLGIGARAVVRAHRTSELKPEPATAALFRPPLVTIARVLLNTISASEPSLMQEGAERRIVVGSTGRLIRHVARVQVRVVSASPPMTLEFAARASRSSVRLGHLLCVAPAANASLDCVVATGPEHSGLQIPRAAGSS
jgi:hypothetical protein